MWASVCVSTKKENHLTLSIPFQITLSFHFKMSNEGVSCSSRAYSLYDVKKWPCAHACFLCRGVNMCDASSVHKCTSSLCAHSEKWRRPHLYKFNQFCELKGKMDVLMKVVLSKTIKGLFAYVLFADDLTADVCAVGTHITLSGHKRGRNFMTETLFFMVWC